MKKILHVILFSLIISILFFGFTTNKTKAATQKHYYQSLLTREKDLYDCLDTLNKDKSFINGNSLDLISLKKVDYQDVNALLSGTSDLYVRLHNAKKAFTLDNPELFYVDFEKVNIRVYQDEKDEFHVELGSGRFENALKDEIKDINLAQKAFDKDVNDVKALYQSSKDVLTLKSFSNKRAVKVALDRLNIENYLMDFGYGLENVVVVDGEEIALNDLSLAELKEKYHNHFYSRGIYDFEYIEDKQPICFSSVDELPQNFLLEVVLEQGIYHINYEQTAESIRVLLPYPKGYSSSSKVKFEVLVNGEAKEAYPITCGIIVEVKNQDEIEIKIGEYEPVERKTVIVSVGRHIRAAKESFTVIEERSGSVVLTAEDGYLVDFIGVDGITYEYNISRSQSKTAVINYDDLKDFSILTATAVVAKQKEKEFKPLKIEEPKLEAKIIDVFSNNKKENQSFYKQDEPVCLVVEASHSGSITYEWYKNGELLKGEDSNILIINKMTPEIAGEYECKITLTTNLFSKTATSNVHKITFTKVDTSTGINYIVILGIILLSCFIIGNIFDNNNQKFQEKKKNK